MPSIQIKNVPAQTHEVLRRRAKAAHQSLQEYLLSKLVADAATPTVDEVFDRVDQRDAAHLTFEQAADAVRSDRDRHGY